MKKERYVVIGENTIGQKWYENYEEKRWDMVIRFEKCLFTKEEAEKLLEIRKKEFNAKQLKFYIEEF